MAYEDFESYGYEITFTLKNLTPSQPLTMTNVKGVYPTNPQWERSGRRNNFVYTFVPTTTEQTFQMVGSNVSEALISAGDCGAIATISYNSPCNTSQVTISRQNIVDFIYHDYVQPADADNNSFQPSDDNPLGKPSRDNGIYVDDTAYEADLARWQEAVNAGLTAWKSQGYSETENVYRITFKEPVSHFEIALGEKDAGSVVENIPAELTGGQPQTISADHFNQALSPGFSRTEPGIYTYNGSAATSFIFVSQHVDVDSFGHSWFSYIQIIDRHSGCVYDMNVSASYSRGTR